MNDKNWRRFRIFHIWLNGKIELAKRMKKRAMFEYCKSLIANLEPVKPTYQYIDTRTMEVKESDTPISATTTINKENYNQ